VREKDVDNVVRAVLDAGGRVISVVPHRASLEDIFLSTVAQPAGGEGEEGQA